MIVRHSWCNGQVNFTVDSEELAAWMREHPSQLAEQAIFRGKAHYGIVGNMSARPNTDFQDAFDSGKPKAGK